jgi:hypothetical protein
MTLAPCRRGRHLRHRPRSIRDSRVRFDSYEMGLGRRHCDAHRSSGLPKAPPSEQTFDEARLGGREEEGRGHGLCSVCQTVGSSAH